MPAGRGSSSPLTEMQTQSPQRSRNPWRKCALGAPQVCGRSSVVARTLPCECRLRRLPSWRETTPKWGGSGCGTHFGQCRYMVQRHTLNYAKPALPAWVKRYTSEPMCNACGWGTFHSCVAWAKKALHALRWHTKQVPGRSARPHAVALQDASASSV